MNILSHVRLKNILILTIYRAQKNFKVILKSCKNIHIFESYMENYGDFMEIKISILKI